MIISVNGERNFFLYQDIYYWFAEFLNGKHDFPIENKHYDKDHFSRSVFEYVYDSWLAVLKEKLSKAGLSDIGEFLKSKLSDWMITTNIAIITAQKGKGIRDIPSNELEYLEKYQPFFLIEHSDDYEKYIIHLDGDMKVSFLYALEFYNSFKEMNAKTIIKELTTLFNVSESDIEKEVYQISEHFYPDLRCIETFEIVEE